MSELVDEPRLERGGRKLVEVRLLSEALFCGCGEIGKRSSLRCCRANALEGSSPFIRTFFWNGRQMADHLGLNPGMLRVRLSPVLLLIWDGRQMADHLGSNPGMLRVRVSPVLLKGRVAEWQTLQT